MKLTPREKDKLMIYMAGIVARDRKERGLKLNYPEAIALIERAAAGGDADATVLRQGDRGDADDLRAAEPCLQVSPRVLDLG